ncbi:MAG: hypothetical protein FWG77_04415 [Treponema sp.]|nr:hypothetical protein [Treponema sp.]
MEHKVLPEESSFDDMLDAACERLWEKQISYSVRRIKEMDDELLKFEIELNEFLSKEQPD